MTPEDHTAAIHALQNAISEIKAILNNGIRTMVNDQKTELVTVKDDIQSIRDTLTSHVAKEDVVYEIFKRVMNTGVSITTGQRRVKAASTSRTHDRTSLHDPQPSKIPLALKVASTHGAV